MIDAHDLAGFLFIAFIIVLIFWAFGLFSTRVNKGFIRSGLKDKVKQKTIERADELKRWEKSEIRKSNLSVGRYTNMDKLIHELEIHKLESRNKLLIKSAEIMNKYVAYKNLSSDEIAEFEEIIQRYL